MVTRQARSVRKPAKKTKRVPATRTGGAKKAVAGDPVQVDSQHYTVELENNRVRVLRIRYGPREVSVMHNHPAAVAVFLTDGHARFTLPQGKTEEQTIRAGAVVAYPAGDHLPENLSDQPLELVLVELKG
jgi:quercetin dioxygenase-like cupin family protein